MKRSRGISLNLSSLIQKWIALISSSKKRSKKHWSLPKPTTFSLRNPII